MSVIEQHEPVDLTKFREIYEELKRFADQNSQRVLSRTEVRGFQIKLLNLEKELGEDPAERLEKLGRTIFLLKTQQERAEAPLDREISRVKIEWFEEEISLLQGIFSFLENLATSGSNISMILERSG